MICKETVDWTAIAAWVQAVGSIAAIAAATAIAGRQSRDARTQRLADSAAHHFVAARLAGLATGLLNAACEVLTGDGDNVTKPENFRQVVGALRRLPLELLTVQDAAVFAVELERMVEFFGDTYSDLMERAQSGRKLHTHDIQQLLSCRKSADYAAARLIAASEKADRLAGADRSDHPSLVAKLEEV